MSNQELLDAITKLNDILLDSPPARYAWIEGRFFDLENLTEEDKEYIESFVVTTVGTSKATKAVTINPDG